MAAPPGNKYGEGEGRPTKYDESYDKLAYNYCLLGATDKQLAKFLGVCEATINNWKETQPSFLESLRAGKVIADIDVAKSLYEACKGAVVVKQKEVRLKEVHEGTGKLIDRVEIVDLVEQLPGDVNAMKFWLTNRQKENWANKTEQTIIEEQPLFPDVSKDDSNK